MKVENCDGTRWGGGEGRGHEAEGGGGDEADDGEAEAAEEGVEGRLVLVLQEPAADDEDEGQRQDEDGEGGDDGSGDGHGGGIALGDDGGVAGIGGGVDPYGAGGNLADGQDVGKLLGGEPRMLLDDGALDEGYHRVASAEGEEADEKERVEKLKKNHLEIIVYR